jgi:hypothetical protein
MDKIQDKAKRDSFYIALIYVGIGTIPLFAMTCMALVENDFTYILIMVTVILTMPVSFLGFGTLWGVGENARLIMLVVQVGVFVLFWYLVYRYLLHARVSKKMTRGNNV